MITEVSNMNDEEEETMTTTTTMMMLKFGRGLSHKKSFTRRLIEDNLQKLTYLINKTAINSEYSDSIGSKKKVIVQQTHRKQQQQNRIMTRQDGDTNFVMSKCLAANKSSSSLDRDNTQTKKVTMSSIHDHLIKLTMFLVTIFCSQQTFRANCQRHHLHHYPGYNHGFLHNNEHSGHILNQRQMLDHLIRTNQNFHHNQNNNKNHHHHHHHHINQQQNPHQHHLASNSKIQHQAADRRASSVASSLSSSSSASVAATAGTNQQQQHQGSQTTGGSTGVPMQGDNGKLLICYYTTRQSAPYWPKDAREYVIPPEGLNTMSNTAANDIGGQAAFAPILQYEPFASASSNNNQQQQQQGSQDYGFGSNDNNLNIKNQQQQLLFKSAAVLQASPQQLTGGQVFNGIGTSKSSSSANSNYAINNGNRSRQHQVDAISQMLTAEHHHQQHQQLHHNNPLAQQQSLVITGPTLVVGNASNKNKQTPAYSFVGDLDGNNGFIVGRGSGTIGSSSSLPATLGGHNGGNNGNGFIINKDNSGSSNNNNNNNGNHLERNSMKQAQQLVFSPSLSRAFIVGGGNSNNEVLDTKSQLFIPSSQTTHNNNNNNHYHQQTTTTTTSTTASLPLYQQHDVAAILPALKGKSLQVVSGGEQLSLASHPFSGAVSSAPPVPLSSASSASLVQTTSSSSSPPTSYRNSPQQQQQQFSTTTTNINQLIVSNGQMNGQTKSPTTGGNILPGSKLQYPTAATNGDVGLGAKSSSSSPPPLPTSSSSNLTGAGSSSTSMNSISSPSTSSTGTGSLSSALVSSPLSTMFDVFGAASQYLMRFKPSSLISPSSFAFNTIPSDHLHHPHHGLKSGNSSQYLLGPNGSPASLIPLPFSTSLIANMQKSSSSSSSNDRISSSSSTNSGTGILSRFAIQNNQRREDVCGRTIQTPQRRIIGGEGARYGEFPYQVHIKIAKHQCGGALVDKQSIVTAAHCVYHFITRAPVSKLQIVIGAYDIEDEQYQELPPQYFKVNKVKLHPNFRFSASHPDRYDIAILKLDKPVKYTDNVLPVCLPGKDLKFESMVGTVTGFGKTDPSLSNRYGTRLLQKVDVPIIENNECERWHRTRGIDLKIFPEMMCAGYEDGLKDACVGDSGGPLVVKTAAGPNGSFRWTLAGITSAGFGCAQSRQPGIYHRVSHTVDWILENLD